MSDYLKEVAKKIEGGAKIAFDKQNDFWCTNCGNSTDMNGEVIVETRGRNYHLCKKCFDKVSNGTDGLFYYVDK